MTEAVRDERIQQIREDVIEIRAAMTKVADALERLARLEERHSTVATAQERAFKALGALDDRVTVLERAQPMQSLATGWAVRVMWAAGAVVMMVVLKKSGVM